MPFGLSLWGGRGGRAVTGRCFDRRRASKKGADMRRRALDIAATALRRGRIAVRGSSTEAGGGLGNSQGRSGGARAAGGSRGGGWGDEEHTAAIRERIRAVRASYAGDDGRAHSSSAASSSSSSPSTSGRGAVPPWSRPDRRAVYDPAAFDEYFSRRPLKVMYRFLEVVTRLSDVGARVYVKRGTIEERAARMRRHFTELGPAFVKLGQVLSTRADLLPASYCEQLGQLQDNLPPASREHALALLRRELDAPPEAFFERIPETPVAAASLAQVYRARTVDGGLDVAVKLQRPGLAESVALDATILRLIARIVRRFVRLRSDVVGIVDELIGRIFDEMDYRREADSIRRFRDVYRVGGGAGSGLEGLVRAPAVLDELSTRAVLVMEWIDGARLTDVDAVAAAGLTPSDLLERGVRCSLHQLLETGFMHSDPHPGNLLVAPDGSLVYLDFGMVVEVSPGTRRAMIRGLVGFVNRDANSLVGDLRTLDFLPLDVDHAAAGAALRGVFQASAGGAGAGEDAGGGGVVTLPSGSAVRGTNDFLGVVSQLSAALLVHDFRLPPYFARILRALAALEGTATGIDREFKVIERAYPYVLAQLLADKDPEMRDILRRLVLEPCGTSVRWSRVRRLLNAYVESGGGISGAKRKANAAGAARSEPFGGCRAAETAAGLAAGARALASGRDYSRHEDDDAAAAAAAVRDALAYVMSPSGAPLRVTLVRDFLDALDAYLEVMEEEEDQGSGGGDPEGDAFFSAEDLKRLAETGRSVYLRAPTAWAPVVVNAVMREEACEMAGRVAQGVSERVTRDNTRRLVKRVVENFFASKP